MERDPPSPSSPPFVAGTPYRALRTLRVWVFTFDELAVTNELLREGADRAAQALTEARTLLRTLRTRSPPAR
jgi:hypothetical protein